MRNPILPLLALLAGLAAPLTAQNTNQWDLFLSLDWPGRLAYLKDGAAPRDDAFLVKALDLTDAGRIETGSDNEVAVKLELAIFVVRLLADRPAAQAAPAIARLPVQYRDPRLRGESWLALAKLGDKTAVAGLNRSLTALNESGQRTRGEEVQAGYILQALGLLKAPEAFRAVAAASQAWYSPASGVRALAKKTLPLLTDDPDGAMDRLLGSEEDLSLVEGLFQMVLDQGPADRAARGASAVLTPLVRLIPRDKDDQDRAYRLTLGALTAAQKASSPPATLVPSLKFLLTKNENAQQMIQSIQLLGKIDDPSALAVLTDLLKKYNGQQKAGTNSTRDLTMARETIYALAQTGRAAARAVLDEARFSDYTPAMAREAAEALGKLPRE